MQFGFSYVGLVYLIMLMLPNILWTKNQPKDYEKYVGNENKVLLFLERAGEVLVTCLALIFSDYNLRPWSAWSWWLASGGGVSSRGGIFPAGSLWQESGVDDCSNDSGHRAYRDSSDA